MLLVSKIRILGSLSMALAIAILCLWPPLSFIPLSPTIVSNWSGNELINSKEFDFFAASMISSSVASGLP